MESSAGLSAGQDMSSSPVLASPAVSNTTETANERSFRQSEVNEIVKRAKNDAVETFRRQQATQPEYVQSKYGESPQSNSAAPNESSIRQIVAEETARQREAWQNESRQKQENDQAQQIVNKFFNKISAGKEKYQDFEKVTGNVDLRPFPNAVHIITEAVDNTADVLYELSKDPQKLAQIEWLAEKSPQMAIAQAQRLAQSIKDNEAATKVRMPNEPLSQMHPTNTGLDNGALSVSDYRKKFRTLRR